MADSTILHVKGDVLITTKIPLDLDLLEGGIWGGLGPGDSRVHGVDLE